MIKTKVNKKKIKLNLNKQTIIHLNPEQMARLGGGCDGWDTFGLKTCNTCQNGNKFQSCECPTYDTGIPPYSNKKHPF
ncbi:MAG: class I lanthipeptide [Acidobacteria bacterium]|jgi:hypothetical protein|nr:class I lanthipeptide [Acidobacteriota bacterium]